MIFHCTKALAIKLPNVSSVPLADTNPIGSWHAHLHLIDRRQCVMFCHDKTRFVLFQAGLTKDQFSNLGKVHKELYQGALISLGASEANIKRVELVLGPAKFDTATDRSVLGTLNQSRSDFDCYIPRYSNILEIDPVDAARWLNERPMTARGMFESQYNDEMEAEVKRLEAKMRATNAGHPEWDNAWCTCMCELQRTEANRCDQCR